MMTLDQRKLINVGPSGLIGSKGARGGYGHVGCIFMGKFVNNGTFFVRKFVQGTALDQNPYQNPHNWM